MNEMKHTTKYNIKYRDFPIEDDGDALVAILEATGFFYPEEIDIALELLNEKLKFGDSSTYQFIFAEYESTVVGYICYGKIPLTKASYDVYWIAVDPHYQGKGIGYALLQQAEEKIRHEDGKHFYIETSGRKLYQPTHAFYLKAGYTIIAVFKDFYADGDDKLVFYKKLL
ncbi:MAG: GNAT family N-acetyltransferase [Spirochaetes bacterium]|nr:GNAT family N-acetyltransferase [Spirochaetota bacterium]